MRITDIKPSVVTAAAPTVTVTVSSDSAAQTGVVYSTVSVQMTSYAVVTVTETQSVTVTAETTTTEMLTSSSTISTSVTTATTTTASTTVVTTETATPVGLLAIAAEETGYISISSTLNAYVEDDYTPTTEWLFEGESQYPYIQGGRDGASQYLAYSEGDGTLQLWSSSEIEANNLVQPVCEQFYDANTLLRLECHDPTTPTINKFVSCTSDDDDSTYMQLVEAVPSECTEITKIVVGGVRTQFVVTSKLTLSRLHVNPLPCN